MEDEVCFRPDLYAGTAEFYERYRPGYPPPMLERLIEEAEVSGHGRLLDLACGTGQVAFGLCRRFEQVWAVDQEPDMIRVGRSKGEQLRVDNIQWHNCPAEDLAAPPGFFELVTVGNAFQRLPRQLIARRAFDWLRPGRCLALLWGGIPWQESQGWQRTLTATSERWMGAVGAHNRVPAGWEKARAAKPDVEVLREAGFEVLGRFSVPVTQEWTLEGLVGFAYSTSFLSRAALGGRAGDFEADLRHRLEEEAGVGPYVQVTEFACDLGRRGPNPGPLSRA
jgi:SAM-dependent methyltransferase